MKPLENEQPKHNESGSDLKVLADDDLKSPKWLLSIHALLLGSSGLLTWNSFISVMDFFDQMFPRFHPNYYFPLFFEISRLTISLIIGPLSSFTSTKSRISLTGLFLSLIFITFPLVIYLLRDSTLGYLVFFFEILVISALSSIMMLSGLGFLINFEKSFMNFYSLGFSFGGIIMNVLRAVFLGLIRDKMTLEVFVFFAFSFFVYLFVSVSQIYHERSPKTLEAVQEKTKITFTLMIQTYRRIFRFANEMLLIYIVTLCVFPVLCSAKMLTFADESWSFLIIVSFYNAVDLLGRSLCIWKLLDSVSDFLVSLIVYFRFLFIPWFFILKHFFTQSVATDLGILLPIALFGVSNGYATNILLTRTPKRQELPSEMHEPAGFIMMLFLILGLLVGSFLASQINAIELGNDQE